MFAQTKQVAASFVGQQRHGKYMIYPLLGRNCLRDEWIRNQIAKCYDRLERAGINQSNHPK